MNLDELNDLNLNNIGEWPIQIKAIAILLACLAIGGGVYYFDTQEQIIALEKVQAAEVKLRSTFETKQRRAVSLPYYKKMLEEMKERLTDLLRLLPSSTEVPALLVDVSQTGLSVGLDFQLFQPLKELNREFYAELPISVRVTGGYTEFGQFISGLASLPRIVTIHDIKISNTGGKSDPRRPLALQAVLKTYRYLEEGTK